MNVFDSPLTSASAWRGVWMRSRSGPTSAAAKKPGPAVVDVSLWHRIAGVRDRLVVDCSTGPRGGYGWPAGGARLEIARPIAGDFPSPGDVCPYCAGIDSAERGEIERLDVAGRTMLERLRSRT